MSTQERKPTMTVATTRLIARMVIREKPYIVEPPVVCEPGKRYAYAVDEKAGRIHITEEGRP